MFGMQIKTRMLKSDLGKKQQQQASALALDSLARYIAMTKFAYRAYLMILESVIKLKVQRCLSIP